MNVEVVVTGIAIVSALGELKSTWKQILSGNSGINLHQPFSEFAPIPLALIGKNPSDLITLTRQVLAAAILDADLILPLPDCGLVIGSSRGNQAKLEQLARDEIKQKQEIIKPPITKARDHKTTNY